MRINLKEILLALPYAERAAMLVCSIIEEHKNSPVAPVIHMVKASKVMALHLNTNDRIRVANAFRDAADEVENRHRRVAVS
jgi:hypothetical protein